jgi:hypothetical protein
VLKGEIGRGLNTRWTGRSYGVLLPPGAGIENAFLCLRAGLGLNLLYAKYVDGRTASTTHGTKSIQVCSGWNRRDSLLLFARITFTGSCR